ncbi:MAG: alanine--tRNA ligase-related protein, partial [Pseudomonadota bacterium]
MTTEALHKSDPYLTSCAASVLSAGPEGIVLDRTVFYPTGGGQPGDPGVLRWAGGETPIATATKGE